MTTRLGVPMEAESVDPQSEDLVTWADVMNQCMLEEWGEYAQCTPVEFFRDNADNSAYNSEFIKVTIRNRIAGVGVLEIAHEPKANGCREAYIMARVLQSVQGYGVGRIIMRELEERAREIGATDITTVTAARSYRDDRTTRIVRKAGYEETRILMRMDIQLPKSAVFTGHFPTPSGYRIETAVDKLTPSQVESVARLNQLLPSPRSQLELDSRTTPDGVQAMIDDLLGLGHFSCFSMAVEEATGRMIAYVRSDAAIDTGRAEQNPLIIEPEHRNVPGLIEALLAQLADLTKGTMPGDSRMRLFATWDESDILARYRNVGYKDVGFYRDWSKHIAG